MFLNLWGFFIFNVLSECEHTFSLKRELFNKATGIFWCVLCWYCSRKESQTSTSLGISEKLGWWRKSFRKRPGPQKHGDKFDPLRRWLIVYLSLLVSWSYNDYCQQGCPFLWQSWHCWVQIKGKSDFLASERGMGMGEGWNLFFLIFLFAVSSLSRRLSSRKFKQRRCTQNGEVFAGSEPIAAEMLLFCQVSPNLQKSPEGGTPRRQTPQCVCPHSLIC